MEQLILPLVVLIVGLVLGGAVAWFFASRPLADLRERLAERESDFKRAVSELGEAQIALSDSRSDLSAAKVKAEQSDALAAELSRVRDALRETEVALERHRTEASEREKAAEARIADRQIQFEAELKRLAEAEEKLQAKFNEIGEKMLVGAQAKFLEGAQANLASLNKETLAELEKKVGPVGDTLERYRKRVEEMEKNRTEAYHQLQGVIGEVRAGQERVVEGANRIATTLRGATKARGDWGELQLANLLESCGLYDKSDFDFQATVKDEHGNSLRPDAVINIPGGRRLVVDVKNVFNTYARANEADSEEERLELLRGHARELRTHIDDLAGKRYQDHVEGSADFVVMFVPGEHVLYAALTLDSGLLDYALKRQIVLSSPLNFMSIALTVSTVWRQAGVQADAKEIAKLGKELYDRLGIVAGHLSNLRRDLSKANKSFDSLVGSFDTNLRRTGERFERLSIDTSAQDITEALPLNTEPRRLANFADDADR